MAEPGDGEADQRHSGDKEEVQGEDARDSVATVSRKRKMEASDAKLASSAADATSSLRILRRKRLRYPRYTTLKEIHTGQAYSYGWFPTGFRALDELLGSREVPHGISTGEMIEVVGESSIGKTQLCLTVCGHLIRSSQERAIFIDTAHSFDPKRLQQIYVHSSRQPTKPIEKAFEQIHVYRVFNIFALHTLLVKIQDSMEKNIDSFYARMRLLVIDSLSALLAQNLGGDISSGTARGTQFSRHFIPCPLTICAANAIIAETGRMIKHIAHKYQIAVLVCAHARLEQNHVGVTRTDTFSCLFTDN